MNPPSPAVVAFLEAVAAEPARMNQLRELFAGSGAGTASLLDFSREIGAPLTADDLAAVAGQDGGELPEEALRDVAGGTANASEFFSSVLQGLARVAEGYRSFDREVQRRVFSIFPSPF